jgi:hypothetical protein
MPDVSYVPGALIAVSGERCLAVVEAEQDSAATTWIWQRVRQGTSAEALLAGLLGGGFEGLSGFALLADLAAGPRRLFCRGAVAATVQGGNVSARIDGVGLATWREYGVASDAERIVLGDLPGDTMLRLPVAAGVLLASCVIIDLTSAASRDTTHYGGLAAESLPPARPVEIIQAIAQPDNPALPAPVPQTSPGGLIDAVDWGTGLTAAADPAAPRPGWVGPLVPALICPDGHVNPPSEAVCRRCEATLPDDPVAAPRPALGVLRLSTGDVVVLDRGVVLGRDPRTDFVGFEREEPPHVVRLPIAGGDISRTHVRVTLDGWHVLVTDLKSINGTVVTLPGRSPERLRPGETVPIKPGTVVTLADGIDFRYEAAE